MDRSARPSGRLSSRTITVSAAGVFPMLMHEMTHNLHFVSILHYQRTVDWRDTATTLQLSPFSSQSPTPTASTSVTPTPPPQPMVTSVGEPLQSDYQIHELPPGDGCQEACCAGPDSDEVVLNTALLARIEAQESQNRVLRNFKLLWIGNQCLKLMILPEMTNL